MWCTQCNTAFCWATGRIQTQNIHNPHYFEWLRNNPNGSGRTNATTQNPALMECGVEINHMTASFLLDAARRHPSIAKPQGHSTYAVFHTPNHTDITFFTRIVRNIVHMMQIETASFRSYDYVRHNEDLRVAYLEGKCTDSEFKTEIQRRDKKNRKNIEINQIFQFASTASTDIIYRLITHLREAKKDECILEPFIAEFKGLVTHCNDLFKEVSRTYGTIQYHFQDELQFIRAPPPTGWP
jgi:hypothetical protein